MHKSDAGAVVLGLATSAAVETAAREMGRRLADAEYADVSFVVQPMAPGGTEMLVGMVADPQLGPVVACGAGGTLAEVLSDLAVGLAPLCAGDAGAMIDGLRCRRLLAGYRGAPPADVGALAGVVERVAALAAAHPEVAELDLNPIVAAEHGARVLDARARVRPADLPSPGPSLQSDWP